MDTITQTLQLPDQTQLWTPKLRELQSAMLETAKLRSLFSKRELQDRAEALILGSLALWPFIKKSGQTTVLDIGGGNGIPGLVLAARWPHLQVIVAESSEKIAATCHHLIKTAELENATCQLNPLGPHYKPVPAGFLTSRATALFCSTWNNFDLPKDFAIFGQSVAEGEQWEVHLAQQPIATLKSNISLSELDIKECWHES